MTNEKHPTSRIRIKYDWHQVRGNYLLYLNGVKIGRFKRNKAKSYARNIARGMRNYKIDVEVEEL